MATSAPEVELLGPGIKANVLNKGSFVLNMFERKGAWEVRGGMGQASQHDTTLGLPPQLVESTEPYGVTKVLGSHVLRSDFGATQIVTLLLATNYTGNAVGRGIWSDLYVVSIFDPTTRERWEEVLHRHTSQNNSAQFPMQDWFGNYETCSDIDRQAWLSGRQTSVFFCEYQDNLFFGSVDMGLWCYVPSDFSGTRWQQVEGIRSNDASIGYSESSRVFPVAPVPGQFTASYAYLDAGGFPVPSSACVLNGRLLYAQGRTVYFAEVGTPCSIIAGNSLDVPAEDDITAIGECFGSLIIWTPRETWQFLPPATGDAFLSGGTLRRLSETVGCLGPMAHCRAEEVLVWASLDGIYATTANWQIKRISDDIRPLFDEQLANPLSSYWNTVQAGYSPSEANRLPLEYDWTDTRGVALCYDISQRLLLVGLPAFNIALCHQDGKWGVWSFDSLATGTPNRVGVTRNVVLQQLLAKDGEVWLVGGVEAFTPNDAALLGGVVDMALEEDKVSGSYYILQWRRGGALDRSVEIEEDRRTFAGYYGDANFGPPLDDVVVLERPVLLPLNYVLPQGAVCGGLFENVLVPVVIYSRALAGFPPTAIEIIVRFDNTNWQPWQVPGQGAGTARVDATLPPERLPSKEGWGLTAALLNPGGGAEVQVYDSGTGLPDAAGDELRIRWHGMNGGTPWMFKPSMNLAPRTNNPLIFIPFRKLANVNTMSMGFDAQTVRILNGAVASNLTIAAWHYASVATRHQADDVTQAVDWAWKSAQTGDTDRNGEPTGAQVKARGLFARILSHGRGTVPIVAAWPLGLFNVVISSDWKEWSSQIVDNASGFENDLQSKVPLRSRVKTAAGAMVARVFNGSLTWGDTGTAATGNFMVDDEQVDTVSISDAVRGEHVSWMLFGHMMSRSERLVIQSVRGVLRKVAGRRRTGR